MKNAGMAGAVALVGIGLITIGLGNFVKAPQAVAAPVAAVVEAGPEERTIVWYDSVFTSITGSYKYFGLMRAWSDGTIEAKVGVILGQAVGDNPCGSVTNVDCAEGWIVISSPTEGLSAQADINFDEVVNGGDLGLLLANWGKAPRSSIPASNCPLGLMQ